MDLFSHALLPYLLGSSLRRNKEEITAFVLGGIAPDFDVLTLWVNAVYPTSLLITHRGITHSLFFGFFTALVVLYLASRARVKAAVRRFVDFEPAVTYRAAAFAYAGVLLHLFLDYTTTKGVPLLYPLDAARYSAEVFFYTDTLLTILSLAIIIFLYRKSLQKNTAVKFLVVFLAVFAVLEGARIAEKTDAVEFLHDGGVKAYPTMGIFDWYVLGGVGDKVRIYEYNGLNRTLTYNETVPKLNVTPAGEDPGTALGLAGELPQVKMLIWRAYTVTINASSSNRTWSLEYYDPVQRAMNRGAPAAFRRGMAIWSPDSVKVKVEAGRATVQKS